MERLPGARRSDEGVRCVMRVVKVTGTIKKAEEYVVRRARKEIVRARADMDGKEDKLLESTLGPGGQVGQLQRSTSDVEGIEGFNEDEDMEDDSD